MAAPSKETPAFDLRFGTAGVPLSAPDPDTVSGVQTVASLGLGAMELEFVHGVRLQPPKAEAIRKVAAQLDVALTCHGPYYINLNAVEPEKRAASVQRILDTARAARLVGARSVTFHAAFYLKDDPQAVHRVVGEAMAGILATLRAEGNFVQVRPELTGKPSQYGSLEELLLLSQEVPGVLPCLDFSHLHARTGGAENSLEEFQATLGRYAKALGKDALRDMHIHVSGIHYSQQGELKHLELKDSDLRYTALLKALKQAGVGGVVVCESPNLEEDAQLLQSAYRRIRVG
jgi:deoxyribonuclease-4